MHPVSGEGEDSKYQQRRGRGREALVNSDLSSREGSPDFLHPQHPWCKYSHLAEVTALTWGREGMCTGAREPLCAGPATTSERRDSYSLRPCRLVQAC